MDRLTRRRAKQSRSAEVRIVNKNLYYFHLLHLHTLTRGNLCL
jgi:hypothetical protein